MTLLERIAELEEDIAASRASDTPTRLHDLEAGLARLTEILRDVIAGSRGGVLEANHQRFIEKAREQAAAVRRFHEGGGA